MISELQKRITALKLKTNTAILAHSYQREEILEIADYCGDSFMLAQHALNTAEKKMLICGVHFMAETAKILNPNKRVFLANREAGCPMADCLSGEELKRIRESEPDRMVVCYINTAADVKKQSDVCVTSSSAVKIIKKIKEQKILFVPDSNLGRYVASQAPEKDIKCFSGCCPYHDGASIDDAEKAKRLYPFAKLLVHPECRPEVTDIADFIGSTSEIMNYAKASPCGEFIVGTEISIAEHLSYHLPDKRFYPLSKKILCPEMKLTSLPDVYNTLSDIEKNKSSAFELVMDSEYIAAAKKCIDKMLELGSAEN
ncbi:MAG: quinolinate synthase NadA [Eubacterium sp.]|jgi:quinolinate synthase|nr:quinolinate synthase NadA [Eubacterium sp.]